MEWTFAPNLGGGGFMQTEWIHLTLTNAPISLSVNQDSFEHALEGESHEEKNPINQANSRKQGKVLGDPYPGA